MRTCFKCWKLPANTSFTLIFIMSLPHTLFILYLKDQIALPDFYFGAMENWGLVTYRETNLLYEPEISSNRNKETTVTIIAHELAHMVSWSLSITYIYISSLISWLIFLPSLQWFGNLVTLRWWNEVWLNEGFASYVSYLGADHAEPTWNLVRHFFCLHSSF